jgi:hypothetical protein
MTHGVDAANFDNMNNSVTSNAVVSNAVQKCENNAVDITEDDRFLCHYVCREFNRLSRQRGAPSSMLQQVSAIEQGKNVRPGNPS